jgi:signal peptidase I
VTEPSEHASPLPPEAPAPLPAAVALSVPDVRSAAGAKDTPKGGGWRETLKTIAIAVVVAFGVRIGIAQAYEVDGPSMEPTLFNGERLFVVRCAYGLSLPFVRDAIATWAIPEPGTVVIVESPTEPVDLVKRVVGVPGDVIEIRDDIVYRNGEPIERRPIGPCALDRQIQLDTDCRLFEERAGGRHWLTSRSEIDGLDAPESVPGVVVPAGHVYVLGDHRDKSNDSRYFGPIPIARLRGKVMFVD